MKRRRLRSAFIAFLWIVAAMAATTISIPLVLDAIRQVESGGNPYAIRDNSANRSYSPANLADAVAKAKELLALGHNLDLGAYQINSIHLTRPGVSVDTIFDRGVQSRVAGQIFDDFYGQSKVVNGDTDAAVWRAVGAYHIGTAGLYRDNVPYTSRVIAAAGLRPLPELGGALPVDGRTSHVSGGLLEFGSGPQTPGDWRIGDPIGTDGQSNEIGLPDDSHADTDDMLSDLAVLVICAALVFLLAKVGLLGLVVRLTVKHGSAAAARQLFRRRHNMLR